MDKLATWFGTVVGAVVVALVGYSGWMSGSEPIEAGFAAFVNATVAVFAMFGPPFTIRAWRHHRAWAVAAGVVVIGMLAVNITNSLEFLATKQAKRDAAAMTATDARGVAQAKLDRLTAERGSMAFEPTTEAAVAAAQALAAAERAQGAADMECGRAVLPDGSKPRGAGLGPRCTKADERAATAQTQSVALAAAAGALADRLARTEAAAAKDTEIKLAEAAVAAVPAVADANAGAVALARLAGLEEATARIVATAKQTGLSIALEAIAIVALILGEVLRMPERARYAVAPGAGGNPRAGSDPETKPAPTGEQPPVGAIVADLIEPSQRAHVTVGVVRRAYELACADRGWRAADPAEAADLIRRGFEFADCRIEGEGEAAVIDGVRLRPAWRGRVKAHNVRDG